jgi:hypothetical protein
MITPINSEPFIFKPKDQNAENYNFVCGSLSLAPSEGG